MFGPRSHPQDTFLIIQQGPKSHVSTHILSCYCSCCITGPMHIKRKALYPLPQTWAYKCLIGYCHCDWRGRERGCHLDHPERTENLVWLEFIVSPYNSVSVSLCNFLCTKSPACVELWELRIREWWIRFAPQYTSKEFGRRTTRLMPCAFFPEMTASRCEVDHLL